MPQFEVYETPKLEIIPAKIFVRDVGPYTADTAAIAAVVVTVIIDPGKDLLDAERELAQMVLAKLNREED